MHFKVVIIFLPLYPDGWGFVASLRLLFANTTLLSPICFGYLLSTLFYDDVPSFLCRLHLALNISNWLSLHYVDKINSVNVNQFIFIFCIFMMKNHTVQSVHEIDSNVTFSVPLLQAAWLKAHWSGKRLISFSELGVRSLSPHPPGAV